MPTRAVRWLFVLAAILALAGSPSASPSSALAAATLMSDAPVLADPDPGAASVGWLPAGSAVALDGPPVAGFYPIQTETGAGWVPAASLLLEPLDPTIASPGAAGSGSAVAPPATAATPISGAGPVGPATVAVEAPILAGPGPAFGLLATAPAGSTVDQTGHEIGGYVTVQYAEVTGWAPLDHLAPSTTAEPVDANP